MKHLKYLWYLLQHKWFVFLECCRVGLYWRGLVHDLSKFRPSEWFPYAEYFYGKQPLERQDGYYKPTDTGNPAFDFAWLLHQKRNRHHWQWWVLPRDDGSIRILPMDPASRLEMLCDWRGAGRAQKNNLSTAEWYKKHKDKLQLHPETRKWVEETLEIETAKDSKGDRK